MTNRLFGVLGVLAAIIVVFAVVVVVVAATRSGESFGERVASVVGMDSESLEREHEEAMSEDADDAEIDEMVEFLASIIEDDELSDDELAELEEWLDDDSEVFSFRDLDLFESDEEWFTEEDGDGFEKRRGTLRVVPYEDSEDEVAEWLEEFLEEGEFEVWIEEMVESWEERGPRFSMERRFEFESDVEEWIDEFLDEGGMKRGELEEWFDELRESKGERGPDFGSGGWFGFDGDDPSEWLDRMVEEGVFNDADAEEFESWLEGLEDDWDGGWQRIPGERRFEFDTDDGRFRFRGEWRYGDPGDDFTDDDKDKDRYERHPKRGISF